MKKRNFIRSEKLEFNLYKTLKIQKFQEAKYIIANSRLNGCLSCSIGVIILQLQFSTKVKNL